MAVLDIVRHTAFHLYGFQTIDLQDNETLLTFYARNILINRVDLMKIPKYMVFSKLSFVQSFVDAGFHIVSRLGDDSDLHYNFVAEQKKGRGRKRKI